MSDKITETENTSNKNQGQTQKNDPFAAWKSPEYWKTQGKNFLPLIIGLLVTRGLNLAGWRALLGYMVAAGTTRQIIEQFDSDTTVVLPTVKTSTVVEETQGKSLELPIVNYKIVHAIPGRIRLQVPRVADDIEYAEYVDDLLMRNQGVSTVRINRIAASVLVNYDTAIVSDQEMRLYLSEVIDSQPKVDDSPEVSVGEESIVETSIPEKIKTKKKDKTKTKKDDDELPPSPGSGGDETKETAVVETPNPQLSEPAKIEDVAMPAETIVETLAKNSEPTTIEENLLNAEIKLETEIVPVEEAASFWYCLENITKKTVWWLQQGQPLYSALPLGFQEAVKVRILAIAALANENSSQNSLTGLGSLSYR
ncbi:MAG TPA: hypothetical protein V6D13_18255 [Halomicronema sp.]